MSCRSWIAAGLVTLGLSANPAGLAAFAEDHEHEHGHKHPKSTVATPHTWEQAGYPLEVGMAMESYNEHYSGSYVGGGSLFGHHVRCSDAGTWGWDYTPFRPMSSRIFLSWSHGRRYQGGTGNYKTDGPKPMEHIKETIHSHFGGGE
jgi:hypothetical protein